jgi:hypothetical protein
MWLVIVLHENNKFIYCSFVQVLLEPTAVAARSKV